MKHARPDYDRIQDPLGLIPADEPVFLLRANDMLAPAVIRQWASNAMANGVSRRMVDAALDQAKAMEAWAVAHGGRKVPDLPPDTPA